MYSCFRTSRSCLPNLGTTELILTLTQLGINIEGKPDIVSNKRKLIRWKQKVYKDITEDVDKKPEEQKTTARFAVFCGKVQR